MRLQRKGFHHCLIQCRVRFDARDVIAAFDAIEI